MLTVAIGCSKCFLHLLDTIVLLITMAYIWCCVETFQVQINEFATQMGANESHDDVPSQDNTSHRESPSTYAAPSEDKDFYGESLSPYAAPSEDNDFYQEAPSLYAAPSEDEDFYGESPSLYAAPSEDEDFYRESSARPRPSMLHLLKRRTCTLHFLWGKRVINHCRKAMPGVWLTLPI